METRANYALIGAFVLMAAAAVIGFALWLGSSQFNRDYAVYDVIFPGPVTLEEGASVRYIGIKVGEVETVRIDRRDASMVRARLRGDRATPVKTDSTAIIDFAGIRAVLLFRSMPVAMMLGRFCLPHMKTSRSSKPVRHRWPPCSMAARKSLARRV